MNDKFYGGYSSIKGGVRHDLTRRRTLKKKYTLLHQYGMRCMYMFIVGYGAYMANKWVNPPEYRNEEEQRKA